ncbi:MAG: T9SS type A sorting domain-containing protein [Candidatus Marinimicrobia bacterium]|nr:T9SS type A sorting domain-containing protein [Candidatus Neomarinimicrobiota bacterium]
MIKSYQAEEAVFHNAKIETEHTGFSGDGYVNFDNEIGSSIEFTVFMADADSQTVYIQFANGATSARPMDVMVNSVSIDQMPTFQATGAWTNWVLDSIRVYLISGMNTITFTSSSSDGGPNIDRIDVTGTSGVVMVELDIGIIGYGTIESTPPETLFAEGSSVSLLAVPDSGWQFLEWRGDTSSTQNPLMFVMNSNIQLIAVFISEFGSVYQCENEPIGFASVNTLDQDGTYDGIGGDTIIVMTGADLFTILDERRDARFDQNHPPLVIMVRGTLTWTVKEMMDFKENYDVSLIGEGTDARIEGFGLNLYRSHNIIIRNIEFRNAPDDCINMTDPLSHHIWIDHCTFSDDPVSDPGGSDHDGLLDIKHGASYITVSWCHFYNHRKSNLIGHSASNGDEDSDRLKITYHHNWWESTISRNPRIRFGEVHLYNNYYDNSAAVMYYGVGVTCSAQVFVEANYFENVPTPVLISQVNDYEEVLSGDPAGYIMVLNNLSLNSGDLVENLDNFSFNPGDYYRYQLDDPAILPSLLKTWTGSGRIDMQTAVSLKSHRNAKPDHFSLLQNYPNPFNPTTSICYKVREPGLIRLNVYDMAGRIVVRLINDYQAAGSYSLNFDASFLSSGVYVYRLESNGHVETRKMILMK